MKKVMFFGMVLFLGLLLLVGCGKNSNGAVDEVEPDIINTLDAEGNSIDYGDGYGFKEYELEIEVDGKDLIDIDFTVNDKADAKYNNELTNMQLKNEEAMNEVHKLFIDVKLRKDTPQQEVIERTLKYLRVENYSKFELEVEFNDGTKLDITDHK